MGQGGRLWLIVGLLVSVAAICAGATDTLAQSPASDATAVTLQHNVVKITATLTKGGVPQTGFGFVVGQQGRDLVVVTADHVVRGDDPDFEDKAPLITFFESQGSQVQGRLETVRLPRGRGDLAVILVPRPGFAMIVAAAIDPKPVERGLKVWLVGRTGFWSVPASPGVVAQTDSFTGVIQVEGLAARVGSSGGPLVSPAGIVGMIVADNDLYTEATPIEPIARQVRDVWHYAWGLNPISAPTVFTPPPDVPQAAAPPVVPPVVQNAGVQPPPQVWFSERATPSFPCDKATAAAEQLVCHDPGLAELDVTLANTYQATMSRLSPSDQQRLKRDENAWLQQRNACAGSASMRGCVAQAYRARIAQLERF
jgi:uncharacterized protein YecT (DUF1311 family)